MKYRKDKYGNDISILGYGCMRFTNKAGKIDLEKATSEIKAAYDGGVNYYDTAYLYRGSEATLGEIFKRLGIRENVYIATKLPHYLIRKKEDPEKFFSEELRRLQTDYVDYYLMHMLTDKKRWDELVNLGIKEWIDEKRKSGAIKQVGFSYHGNSDMFIELVDAYDWDFCQIQYNYLDENTQAGRVGLDYAHKKGIPIVIMEPLRGGWLTNKLPASARKVMKDHDENKTPAWWGFSWLYNQPEVTCVLSGMNSISMVEENLKIADESSVGMLDDSDMKMYQKVIEEINSKKQVDCTGCRYCMPCPKNVDIPGTFSAFNRLHYDKWMGAMMEYFQCTTLRADYTGPGNCVECGLCEKHCPQHIEIRKDLKRAKKELEGVIYKIARFFMKRFVKY